ncbi:hypothetical protein CCOS865_00354 [Pseudomonas reidholzensis]|uniref:Uncharacterized protein n=1 Tax=Pseudomonas reidholzensis TaxID=1785162 RepID=A0A383RM82_9PSED|nr:hypothetical protein [Pseudomonas reidholzensis]SYX88132.1 hypothetical protein CCOS865_00354 [Pseudomonas reidholzensis]
MKIPNPPLADTSVAQDGRLLEEIFSLIEAGITQGYDALRYEAELGEGYMQEELTVEKEGRESTDAQRDYNGATLYRLLKELKQNAVNRGEPWQAIKLSYRRGEQVKINYVY